MLRKVRALLDAILITVLVVAAFYLFFIRPTRSEERRRQRDLNDLRVGDTVLTRGGLIAEVSGVETPENEPMVVLLRLAEGVEVRARTAAIAERLATPEEEQDGGGWEDAQETPKRGDWR